MKSIYLLVCATLLAPTLISNAYGDNCVLTNDWIFGKFTHSTSSQTQNATCGGGSCQLAKTAGSNQITACYLPANMAGSSCSAAGATTLYTGVNFNDGRQACAIAYQKYWQTSHHAQVLDVSACTNMWYTSNAAQTCGSSDRVNQTSPATITVTTSNNTPICNVSVVCVKEVNGTAEYCDNKATYGASTDLYNSNGQLTCVSGASEACGTSDCDPAYP